MNAPEKKGPVKTPQDAQAPQDENPTTTGEDTGHNKKTPSTQNDTSKKGKRKNHHP
jgi:hypothetical protein